MMASADADAAFAAAPQLQARRLRRQCAADRDDSEWRRYYIIITRQMPPLFCCHRAFAAYAMPLPIS